MTGTWGGARRPGVTFQSNQLADKDNSDPPCDTQASTAGRRHLRRSGTESAEIYDPEEAEALGSRRSAAGPHGV